MEVGLSTKILGGRGANLRLIKESMIYGQFTKELDLWRHFASFARFA